MGLSFQLIDLSVLFILHQAVSEEGPKNGQRLPPPKSRTATARQAVPVNQVWNQQDQEQLLPPSHKTAK